MRLSPRLPDLSVSLNVKLRLAVFGVVREVNWQTDEISEVIERRNRVEMVSKSAARAQSGIGRAESLRD